ncbi:MAG: amidohydrolase family protein [Burkholderiales bacterium]|nr:amidohydrolase family protein [Burkholderiales bacterium]
MHDLVISNARVYDGLGSAPIIADVAIGDGRITAVAREVGAARERIDADGLALMPGIIDSHTHYDAQITWDPLASPSPELGVTTVVMGNCGFTLAPCRARDRDLNLRNLTHVEGMSLESLRAGVNWSFESFPQYLDFLERQGVGPNVAAYIGHSSVRTWVMGEDASRRAATADEIGAMRELVLEGLEAGAVGLSSTTSYQHNGEGGVPMPSRLASDEEFHALASALCESGRGTFMMTKSSDTTPAWLQALASSCRRPFLAAAILYNPGVPAAAWNDMQGVAQGRVNGLDMYGAVSRSLKLSSPCASRTFEGLRAWKPVPAAGAQGAAALYADAAFRQAVKDELAIPARRIFAGDWNNVHVVMVRDAHRRGCAASPLPHSLAAAGSHPFDWLLDLALAEDLQTVFTAVLLNSDEIRVARLLTHPNSIVSLSDAGAHMTFFCDAGFGLHFLGHWVRESDLMPIEQAVRKLTFEQARLFGMPDRGVVRTGAWAIAPAVDAPVGRGDPIRHFDLPDGGSRLHTPARGVHGVWVNGVRIADAAEYGRRKARVAHSVADATRW